MGLSLHNAHFAGLRKTAVFEDSVTEDTENRVHSRMTDCSHTIGILSVVYLEIRNDRCVSIVPVASWSKLAIHD